MERGLAGIAEGKQGQAQCRLSLARHLFNLFSLGSQLKAKFDREMLASLSRKRSKGEGNSDFDSSINKIQKWVKFLEEMVPPFPSRTFNRVVKELYGPMV